MRAMPFDEWVCFRKLRSDPDKKASMGTTWAEGVWLGYNRGPNAFLVGTPSGVV